MLTVITPPVTNDLTVVATVQRELQLTRAEDIEGLADLIAEASGACASYCRRPEGFGLATVRQTERLARAIDCIILARDLAVTISGVTVDGEALTATDYELDGSLLYRRDGDRLVMWSAGVVEVTYSAGYATLGDLPWEIERACIQTVAAFHAARGVNPMLTRESNSVTTVAYAETVGGLPPSAAALLNPWVRIAL